MGLGFVGAIPRVFLRFVFLFLFCNALAFGVQEPIRRTLENNARGRGPEAVILSLATEILSDTELEHRKNETSFRIFGREAEADEVLDVLTRMKGAVPVLVGPAGVGKTTIVSRAVQKSILNKFPKSEAYKDVLSDSVWISTTPARIARLSNDDMDAVEQFAEAVIALEKKYQRSFVIFIDEIHTLNRHQAEALLPFLDSRDRGIRVVGASNSGKFQLAFKDNEAFLRRAQTIGVRELTEAETIDSLSKWWIPQMEKHYGVKFADDVPEGVVRLALEVNPEMGRFDSSLKLLQDIAIRQIRLHYEAQGEEMPEEEGRQLLLLPPPEGQNPENHQNNNQGPLNDHIQRRKRRAPEEVLPVTLGDAYAFVTDRTGIPVNPHDSAAILRYIDGIRGKINDDIIDQPRMVEDVLRLYQSVMVGSKKGLGVAALVGPTGTGKSELGLALSKLAFKNPGAFLRIDANEYKVGSYSLNKLFGAEGGLITSNTRSGLLCDYFDDPSKGKYGGVILIDESERAHPDFWERLMEFFDTGSFVGGDGKRRHAKKHIVILTSNRGDKVLFPDAASKWSDNEMQTHVDQITPKDLKELFLRKISGKDEFSLPPPILNRVDVFSVAAPIRQATAERIVKKVLKSFAAETQFQFKVDVEVDEQLIRHLNSLEYNLRDGARPIIHKVSQLVQDARSQALARMSLNPGAKIRLALAGQGAGSFLEVSSDGKESLRVDIPQPKANHPLMDDEERARLRSLNANLKQEIVGQDEAIDSLSRAVMAHRVSAAQRKRPLSLFLIGTTGVGKTGLGKGLSKSLYGSEDRTEVISLGQITNEAQFNKVFGSDPGYIGSEQERSFEEALRNSPNGGVLIWDEASNMGGQNKELKEVFFKKFYDIIDEGSWTSPATGHTYDLSKWVFLFTGNDGEKLFRGVSSDELLLHTWKSAHERENVREILLESGVPQAFIGRQADCILMKPLIRSEVFSIGKKFLVQVAKSFTDHGIQVEMSDRFYEDFGKSFFSTDMGARSLRAVAENRIQGMIAEALLMADVSVNDPEVRVVLDLADLRIKAPYRRDRDPEQSVKVTVRVRRGNEEVYSQTVDLSEYAAIANPMTYEQAIKTAYHEAGHAVANDPRVTGQRLTHVTIRTGKGYLGYAHYERDKKNENRVIDREAAIAIIGKLLAGQMAMVMAGYEPDSGWSNDLERARTLATRLVVEWGLAPGMEAIPLDAKEKKPMLNAATGAAVQSAVSELLQEGRAYAQDRLNKEWPLIRRTVAGLLQEGTITGQQFETWKKDLGGKVEGRNNPRGPKKPGCDGLLQLLK